MTIHGIITGGRGLKAVSQIIVSGSRKKSGARHNRRDIQRASLTLHQGSGVLSAHTKHVTMVTCPLPAPTLISKVKHGGGSD